MWAWYDLSDKSAGGKPRAEILVKDSRRVVMLCLCGKRHIFFIILAILFGIRTAHGSEADALTISQNIQRFHMPYGTVLDPVFASSDPASPQYTDIAGYARAGDSAIWTGHYLAAEA